MQVSEQEERRAQEGYGCCVSLRHLVPLYAPGEGGAPRLLTLGSPLDFVTQSRPTPHSGLFSPGWTLPPLHVLAQSSHPVLGVWGREKNTQFRVSTDSGCVTTNRLLFLEPEGTATVRP